MKVKELIDELKSYNPQARVIVNSGGRDRWTGSSDRDDWDYLSQVGWVYEKNGETNKNLVKLD